MIGIREPAKVPVDENRAWDVDTIDSRSDSLSKIDIPFRRRFRVDCHSSHIEVNRTFIRDS